MKIIIATKNKHKADELSAMLSINNIEILTLNDFPEIKDIKENGKTFHENAMIKAKAINKKFKYPVLADDSGIEVEYLNNRPGIYSKRYAATDKARINKLLTELQNIPNYLRKARFVCAMVLLDGNEVFKVTGFCTGLITQKPKGLNGFGYDPVFFLPDLQKTMAELPMEQKNIISHRANALKQIKTILIENYEI